MAKIWLSLLLAFSCWSVCLSQNVESNEDKTYNLVELDRVPEFPGGINSLVAFISKSLQYPQEASMLGRQGRVFLTFVVDKEGRITEIQEICSPYWILTKEAIRVVQSMPKWTPGEHQGKKVRVRYVLPITFKFPQSMSVEKWDMIALCNNKADSCFWGIGKKKDMALAYKYYEESAAMGDPYGICRVADMHFNGDGCERDVQKSFELWKKAAAHRHVRAQFMLGQCCYNNTEVVGEVDYEKSAHWLTEAANAAYPDALNELAYCYALGRGVSKDFDKAVKLIDQAIEISSGGLNFYDSKGEILYMKGDKKKAQKVYKHIMSVNPLYYQNNETQFSQWMTTY